MQTRECIPNPSMPVNVKIIRIQKLSHIVIYFRINEDRPNDGFFCFSVVRDAWRCGGGGSFRRQVIGHFFFGFFGLSGGGLSSSGLSLSLGSSNSSFSRKSSKTDKRSVPSFDRGAGSLFSGRAPSSGIWGSGMIPAAS